MLPITLSYCSRRGVALVCLLTVLSAMAACGSGVVGWSPIPFVTTPADGSAALAYLSVPVVGVGRPAVSMVLHGAGFESSARLLVDGAPHSALVKSPTEMEVTFSAADLAAAGRRSIQVSNPSRRLSNTLSLLVTTNYTAVGDSITYGALLDAPSKQAYPSLLAAMFALSTSNKGIGGDQACDLYPRQMYPSQIGALAEAAPLYTLMVGTNDVDQNLSRLDEYEPIFSNCYAATVTWLGTSRDDKVLPGDSALSASGGCAATADPSQLGGAACTGGGTLSAAINSTGNPVYVWYLLADDSPATALLTAQVDDNPAVSATAMPVVPMKTQNGSRRSVGLIRIPTLAGVHRVTIRTPLGGVAVFGIASNRGSSLRPRVVVGDLPSQSARSPVAPVSAQLQYSVYIQSVFTTTSADGLDVRFAPTRLAMTGSPAEMSDSLHPNALGHQHLADAFLSALY